MRTVRTDSSGRVVSVCGLSRRRCQRRSIGLIAGQLDQLGNGHRRDGLGDTMALVVWVHRNPVQRPERVAALP